MHLWCYSHILNLVISDVTKTPISAATMFSSIISFSVFFKESHKRINVWMINNQDNKKKDTNYR